MPELEARREKNTKGARGKRELLWKITAQVFQTPEA